MNRSDDKGTGAWFINLTTPFSVFTLSLTKPYMGDKDPLNFNHGPEGEEWMSSCLLTRWSLNGAVTQQDM